jgi:hypothetical protein
VSAFLPKPSIPWCDKTQFGLQVEVLDAALRSLVKKTIKNISTKTRINKDVIRILSRSFGSSFLYKSLYA